MNKGLFLILSFIFFNSAFAQQPELIIPSGQNSWIKATKISSDGKYLVSAAMDRSIKVYDLKEKKEVFTFWEHNDYTSAIDIAPDNRTVASGDKKGEIIIWDLYTGKLHFKLKSKDSYHITAISISPDGKTFLSGDKYGFVAEYNLLSGKLNIEERYHDFAINKIGFIKNGSEFYTSAKDNSVIDSLSNFMITRVSDKKILKNNYYSTAVFRSSVVQKDGSKTYFVCTNPEQIRIQRDSSEVKKIPILEYLPIEIEIISKDLLLIACHKDRKISFLLFDTKTNTVIKVVNTEVKFYEDPIEIIRMQLIPGSQTKVVFTTGFGLEINLTDLTTGNTEPLFPKKTNYQTPLIVQSKLFLAGEDNKLKSWNLKTNTIELLHSSKNRYNGISKVGNDLLINEAGNNIKVWDLIKHSIKDSIGEKTKIFSFNFDSTKVAVGTHSYMSNSINIYQIPDYKLIKSIPVKDKYWIDNFKWFNNSKILYFSFFDEKYHLCLFDLDANNEKIIALSLKNNISSIDVINNETVVIGFIESGSIFLIDIETGKIIKEKKLKEFGVQELKFRKDINQIVIGFSDGEILFLNPTSLEIEKSLKGHQGWISDIIFSEDSKGVISTAYDNTIKIWDYDTGKITSTLSLLNSKDWVVVGENGLFDASPQAMKDIYYVVNDATDTDEPWKIIELEQLKHRFYQPNLLQIQLGYNKEPLRTPLEINEIPLAPKVITAIADNKLKVTVKNQKGGIGKVVFFIENAEIIADLRPNKKSDQDAKELTVVIDLDTYKNRFTTSKEVILKVIAWNKEEWIRSRSEIINYTPIQSKGAIANSIATKTTEEKPRLFGLIVGTSDYSGNQIDLNYASKDAIDFSNALRIASENLFEKNNSIIELLNSDSNDANLKPSRKNILNALKVLEAKIKPIDILVVYLSGHGLNYGGVDGDFYYLTQEASGADPAYLNDEAIRNSSTISSTELTQLLNSITAKKKLLILDACASGKAAEKMTASKDVPASQIRALDRMQDRTGFYILAGSASDAVSYESSVYGQGLLTYSLLKAIKGSALREDGKEEYVDVQKLFQFAVDEVPELSKNIGGIQKPFFKSPNNQQSYDIGKVDLSTKNKIIISEPKPVFIEAVFSDSESLYDELGLSETFNANLQENAAKGKNADIAFMRVKEYAGAYRISGSYTHNTDEIKLNYIVIQNKKPIQPISTIVVSKKAPIQESINQIIESLKSKIN